MKTEKHDSQKPRLQEEGRQHLERDQWTNGWSSHLSEASKPETEPWVGNATQTTTAPITNTASPAIASLKPNTPAMAKKKNTPTSAAVVAARIFFKRICLS